MKPKSKLFHYTLIIILLASCASNKHLKLNKKVTTVLDRELFQNHFTGIVFYNPETRDTLLKQNSNKYFTPASNTKIFTLYSSLKLLPQNIPALKYVQQKDTLYIEGTGDPTLLHPYFKDSTAIDFLDNYNNIALYPNNFQDDRYGPGWAWEDYQYYFQPEKSAFPMYGNIVTIYSADSVSVIPSYFKKDVVEIDFVNNREEDKNIFYYASDRRDTLEIPFKIDSSLTRKLLSEVLGKKIRIADKMPDKEKEVLYSASLDSVCKRMMVESDNFLAEQLLIMASSTLSDTLSGSKTRAHVLDTLLTGLKSPPRWVDGSGLSRYNLFTPESFVYVLNNMYAEIPKDRLFNLFPVGGVSGTLENWYEDKDQPYIHAKSGSLGNNYSLSGYLITKTGKILIFSFMNNHFRQPTSAVKRQMQDILEWVRDSY